MNRTATRTVALLRGLLLLAIGSILLAACERSPETISADEVRGPFVWGAASNVTGVRHLWFSEQPDEAGLEAARTEGVGIVVNLREEREYDWDERRAVENLGMRYVNVPVPGDQPFSPQSFARIDALVKENPDETILVHCSSANRAAGWYVTHLVSEHGMSLDEALVIGRRVGITKEGIVEKVRRYFGRQTSEGSAPVGAGRVSESGPEPPAPDPGSALARSAARAVEDVAVSQNAAASILDTRCHGCRG
jgi:protein tyrosine phosphatase (PTP) superfamily phosphohydrolase (DUF442 family)